MFHIIIAFENRNEYIPMQSFWTANILALRLVNHISYVKLIAIENMETGELETVYYPVRS